MYRTCTVTHGKLEVHPRPQEHDTRSVSSLIWLLTVVHVVFPWNSQPDKGFATTFRTSVVTPHITVKTGKMRIIARAVIAAFVVEGGMVIFSPGVEYYKVYVQVMSLFYVVYIACTPLSLSPDLYMKVPEFCYDTLSEAISRYRVT